MDITLDKFQIDAIDNMKNGCILNGGVGSGKSRTSLSYYYRMVLKGDHKINGKGVYRPPRKNTPLYIITTARKRDTLEWEEEMAIFTLTTNPKIGPVRVVVDSWNNIKKYENVENGFFIFDEQRLVGSGTWVKAFLKIAKKNEWILLSATPGDTWMEYVPVFIANGFYKNRTEFIKKHVVYNPFLKFPKVERYINVDVLNKHRRNILVNMRYTRSVSKEYIDIKTKYSKKDYDKVFKERWNIWKDEPIENVSEMGYALRRVLNSNSDRAKRMMELIDRHDKIIVFYNFNYELDILKEVGREAGVAVSEWNGNKHEPIPRADRWIYLVQYNSNAEGWNCIETNVMVFYSQNYSYKINTQAAGRIDRRNTPFDKLIYYTFITDSKLDKAIKKAISNKKKFNESAFLSDIGLA